MTAGYFRVAPTVCWSTSAWVSCEERYAMSPGKTSRFSRRTSLTPRVAATSDPDCAEITGTMDSAAFGSTAAALTLAGSGPGAAGGRLLPVGSAAAGAAFDGSLAFGAGFSAMTEGLGCLLESPLDTVGP